MLKEMHDSNGNPVEISENVILFIIFAKINFHIKICSASHSIQVQIHSLPPAHLTENTCDGMELLRNEMIYSAK